jgi:EAL domain-containing protein (putative c-di-GMP-specific phosphodiesterase class I)
MVRSINEIGHLTGKLVIAEFAESQEIIQTLRSLGVDYAQGYGIAQPSRLARTPAV